MSRPERDTRPLPLLDPVAAVAVLAYLWVDGWIGVPWLPTWAYLGPVTLPWIVLPPMGLGIVVVWRLSRSRPPAAGLRTLDYGLGILAILTLVGGLYAIVNLNVAHPGVFFAGMVPIGLGFVLAVLVLLWTGFRYRGVVG